MKVELAQVFTQIVAFLLMLWILTRYAWKPLLKTMEDRQKRIQAEHDHIQLQKNHVETMTKEYENKLKELEIAVQEQIQQAVADGKKQAAAIRDSAHQQAKGILARGEADLKHEIQRAKMEIKKELVGMTIAATEKVLNQKIETDQQKDEIANLIKNIAAVPAENTEKQH